MHLRVEILPLFYYVNNHTMDKEKVIENLKKIGIIQINFLESIVNFQVRTLTHAQLNNRATNIFL